MGLLDALFNGDSYGGQQGGLLDLIRSTQANNSQYQPSSGFPADAPPASFADRFNAVPNAPQPVAGSGRQFDSASFDPSTYAPNQAQPIAIGSYQMPRIGGAPLFAADPAALPQNAQSAQGTLPPQGPMAQGGAQGAPAAQPPQGQEQLPPALGGTGDGFLGKLSAGLQSIGNGGSLIGALTGNRTDAISQGQQNLNAQYQAVQQTLLQSGLSPQEARSKAMLAVMNPEAGKTILTEALTNKEKYGVVSEDPLGGKKYGFINEREQTINGKPIGQNAAPSEGGSDMQGMTDKITAMRTQGASKEQMLAQIPTGYRDDVASLIDGKAVPANLGRSQLRGPLLTLAKVIDPSFDETMIPARVQMRKDFAGEGKNGQAIGSLNTVQHHAGQLSDAIEEFDKAGGGSNWPMLNSAKLMLANNTSYDPKLRDSAQKLNDKLNATEHEVASAYNAGHLSDHDLKTWNEIKAANLPADQLRQKLADFDELLSGKRDSLNHIYQTMFHTDAPTIDRKANEETSAKIHSRLNNHDSAPQASSGLPSGWSVKVR